jgi:hypothetical protein
MIWLKRNDSHKWVQIGFVIKKRRKLMKPKSNLDVRTSVWFFQMIGSTGWTTTCFSLFTSLVAYFRFLAALPLVLTITSMSACFHHECSFQGCHGYTLGGPEPNWCGLTAAGSRTTGPWNTRRLMPCLNTRRNILIASLLICYKAGSHQITSDWKVT